jgi:ribose 5-phosphate isomerase B
MERPPESIAIASDHAGFELKERLARRLRAMGFEVRDLGPVSGEPSDYPDYGRPVAKLVGSGLVRRGLLLCGTGLGMSYVANRVRGVRAAVAWSVEVAELSRRHNDANILVLPARFLSGDDAERILDVWLNTAFEGGRHERRVTKIDAEDSAI